MKKALSIQSQCVAAGLALLTLLGTSACKKNESEQKNFKAETGALWWKKEATLVSLPYHIAKAPLPGQTNLAADDSALSFENAIKSCWYYSETPNDPFHSAKAVTPTAVTLDALLLGMSEGEHKETLKDLKDTWITNAAQVTTGLVGLSGGAVAGAVLAVVGAVAVACVLGTGGVFAAPCAAVAAKFAALGVGAATALPPAATTTSAIVLASTAGTLTTTAAGTAGAGAIAGAGVAANAAVGGAVVGGVMGAEAGADVGRTVGQALTVKDFETKLKDLVSTASEDKRMKVEWKQLQALNDIVMKAPSSQATADVCARPEQLDRAAVAAYVGGGTASNTTSP